jgi:hypothetical protein
VFQLAQLCTEHIQVVTAVFIDEGVKPNQPEPQPLIHGMIQADVQSAFARSGEYERNQDQCRRVPKREAEAQ